MKHPLLFICTLLIISFAGFGQKQITDFKSDVSISAKNATALGEINGKLYFFFGDSEVWSMELETRLWKFVGNCPKTIVYSNHIIGNIFYFVSTQEDANWHLNKFDVNTGSVENLVSGQGGGMPFFRNGNIYYIRDNNKLETINVNDNFKTELLLEGNITVYNNNTENETIVAVNSEGDFKNFDVYFIHGNRLIKIDYIETNGNYAAPQSHYKVLKKNNHFLLFEQTNQAFSPQVRFVFLTNLSSGKTDFMYTTKYKTIEEADKYFTNGDEVVHVEMPKPEKAEKFSFRINTLKSNGKIETFEKESNQYNRIVRQPFMSSTQYLNISNFLFTDSSLYFLTNKHANTSPFQDSLSIYINRLDIKTQEVLSTPIEIELNLIGNNNRVTTPYTFRLKEVDKTIAVFPASFTDNVFYFDLNLKSATQKVMADQQKYQNLNDVQFIRLDSNSFSIIDEKKQEMITEFFPDKKIKSSELGFDSYRIIEGNLFIHGRDENGHLQLNIFDGQTLSEKNLGQESFPSSGGSNAVNGYVSITVQGENGKDLIYNLKDKTLITIKKNNDLLGEGFSLFSKRAFSPFVLSNGHTIISVDETGNILNSLLSVNESIWQPVHQFPGGNILIREESENTCGLYDSKFSKIKDLPLRSLYPFRISTNGTLVYFFENEILKSIDSEGEIYTIIPVKTSQDFRSHPYGKFVFIDEKKLDYYILDIVTSSVQVINLDEKKYANALLSCVEDGALVTAYKNEGAAAEFIFYNKNGQNKLIKSFSSVNYIYMQQPHGGAPNNRFTYHDSYEGTSIFLWKNQKLEKVPVSGIFNGSYHIDNGEVVLQPTISPNTKVIADFKNDVYFEISGKDLKDILFSNFTFKLGDIYVFQFRLSPQPQLLFVNSKTKEYSIKNISIARQNFITLKDKAYFKGPDLFDGYEVWSSDGSAEGTVQAFDINPGGLGSNPGDIIELKNNLFVFATTPQTGLQLWQLTDNDPKEDLLLATENPTINFSFYPNPTQDFLNVSSTSETENKYKITVFSTDGKVVSEQQLELPQKLDLSSFKEGTYLINVRAGKENKTFRVVRN